MKKRAPASSPPASLSDTVDHDAVDAAVLSARLVELQRTRPAMFQLVIDQLINAGVVSRPKGFLA